jgi:hypothetical protein
MREYVPLCAFRIDLLPAGCQCCAWWQTRAPHTLDETTAREERRQWMVALEPTWGSTGLISPIAPGVTAAIHYAPVSAIPRLRELPLGPLPEQSVLLFCLQADPEAPFQKMRRVLHKALAILKEREVGEVYAYARPTSGDGRDERCHFFDLDFLEANGFERVRSEGDLYLLRANLRGLLSVVAQLESALGRFFRNNPAPTAATWIRRPSA